MATDPVIHQATSLMINRITATIVTSCWTLKFFSAVDNAFVWRKDIHFMDGEVKKDTNSC
jgi:hypothetical protein